MPQPLRKKSRPDAPGPSVRCALKWYIQLIALLMGPVLFGGPLAGGVWCLLAAVFPENLFGLVLLGVAAFLGYHMGQTYAWIELDGDVLRAKNYWTRWEMVRFVSDIRDIRPLVAMGHNEVTGILDGLMGKVRGYEIRFVQGGWSLPLMRYDMSGVDKMMRALAERGKDVTWP